MICGFAVTLFRIVTVICLRIVVDNLMRWQSVAVIGGRFQRRREKKANFGLTEPK